MKTLIALVMMAISTAATSADVYRDGETLVLKGSGYCFAIGLDNLKSNIQDKAWTPLKPLLGVAINSKRKLTAKEARICFGDDAVTEYIWTVAATSSGSRPVYSWERLASGRLTKTNTGQRLAAGMPCAEDAENVYPVSGEGKSRMWRSVRDSVDLIVYCSKK